jgi:hypothetical protein
VGNCYYYHPEGTDLASVEDLEAEYGGNGCADADCGCEEAPAVACVDGSCRPADE